MRCMRLGSFKSLSQSEWECASVLLSARVWPIRRLFSAVCQLHNVIMYFSIFTMSASLTTLLLPFFVLFSFPFIIELIQVPSIYIRFLFVFWRT